MKNSRVQKGHVLSGRNPLPDMSAVASDQAAAAHMQVADWLPQSGPRMRFAGLRGSVILVLLAGLSGTLSVEEVADLDVSWIFALIIELHHLSLKKFTGNEKP